MWSCRQTSFAKVQISKKNKKNYLNQKVVFILNKIWFCWFLKKSWFFPTLDWRHWTLLTVLIVFDWFSVQRMSSSFQTVPRLSTVCRLDNVVPCDRDGWSTDAKAAFVNMTSTRPMMMKVCTAESLLTYLHRRKEVMFLPVTVSVCLSVCLSVCWLDYWKCYDRIFLNFFWRKGRGLLSDQSVRFWCNPVLDPGSHFQNLLGRSEEDFTS